MSLQIQFNFSHPSGTVISLADWIKTLTKEEQDAFAAAEERNLAPFIDAMNAGKMSIVDGKQVWTSAAERNAVTVDPEYADFFGRYLTENNITYSADEATV